jgi:hypothetical protein
MPTGLPMELVAAILSAALAPVRKSDGMALIAPEPLVPERKLCDQDALSVTLLTVAGKGPPFFGHAGLDIGALGQEPLN